LQFEPQLPRRRASFTIVAERMAPDAWHLQVRELPATWTVAFSRAEIEWRARERIAIDLGCHPADFDVHLLEVMPGH